MEPVRVQLIAHSVGDLLASSQSTDIGSTATLSLAASDSITTSQAQGALKPQELPSGLLLTSLNALNFGIMTPIDLDAVAHEVLGLYDDSTTQDHVYATKAPFGNENTASHTWTTVDSTQFVQSLPKISNGPSMTLEPSITVDSLSLKIPSGESVVANGASTNSPSRVIDTQLGLVSGTQSITANSKSQSIFPSSPTPSLDSTSTLGSDSPISVSTPSNFGTQHILASDPVTSLSPHVTALPDFSRSPPALTIGEQTITADSLGHYLLDNQTLTRGGVITVSDTKISLAPNASDVVVGTSTEALRPSFTAGLGSGANATETQKFSGDALGVRDGLWGSSLMLLVSFFVLLWL